MQRILRWVEYDHTLRAESRNIIMSNEKGDPTKPTPSNRLTL